MRETAFIRALPEPTRSRIRRLRIKSERGGAVRRMEKKEAKEEYSIGDKERKDTGNKIERHVD
jgi:hypothetical protein